PLGGGVDRAAREPARALLARAHRADRALADRDQGRPREPYDAQGRGARRGGQGAERDRGHPAGSSRDPAGHEGSRRLAGRSRDHLASSPNAYRSPPSPQPLSWRERGAYGEKRLASHFSKTR